MDEHITNAFDIITQVISEGIKFWPKEWQAELASQLTAWLEKFTLDKPKNAV